MTACASWDLSRAMFTDDLRESHQKEITLNGVTAKGVKHLIDYAYTSRLSIDAGTCPCIYSSIQANTPLH